MARALIRKPKCPPDLLTVMRSGILAGKRQGSNLISMGDITLGQVYG